MLVRRETVSGNNLFGGNTMSSCISQDALQLIISIVAVALVILYMIIMAKLIWGGKKKNHSFLRNKSTMNNFDDQKMQNWQNPNTDSDDHIYL